MSKRKAESSFQSDTDEYSEDDYVSLKKEDSNDDVKFDEEDDNFSHDGIF